MHLFMIRFVSHLLFLLFAIEYFRSGRKHGGCGEAVGWKWILSWTIHSGRKSVRWKFPIIQHYSTVSLGFQLLDIWIMQTHTHTYTNMNLYKECIDKMQCATYIQPKADFVLNGKQKQAQLLSIRLTQLSTELVKYIPCSK